MTAAAVDPASVRLWVMFDTRLAPWASPVMKRLGNPRTCIPCSDTMPSAHASVRVIPSRPVVSNPLRRAWSVPTSKPEAKIRQSSS